MGDFFEEPTQWRISAQVFATSIAEMALDGARACEGVAMWLGRYEGSIAVVTHVGILRGPHVRKGPGKLLIDSELINDLTDLAIDHHVRLIGQIHSHGPDHGTNLSKIDRRRAIAVPGILSVVAPDYALRGELSIEDCGVHVFRAHFGWHRLSPEEVSTRLTQFEDRDAVTLIAGV